MSIAHRDVILQLIREYQALNPANIEYRNSSPAALEFSRILNSNRPIVFKNSITHWPALQKWQDPDYLRSVMGDQLITVAETPDGRADSIINGYFVEPHQRSIPFSEMLNWLLMRRKGIQKGPIRYVQSQNGNLRDEFERLRGDVCELEWAIECFGEAPEATNVWIGNEESTTSIHMDHYENLYCQIVGSKTFHLVPPTEYACLKGIPSSCPSAKWVPSKEDPTHFILNPQDSTTPWITVDPSKPTALESNNMIRECKPFVVTLQPGEVLYLPALWFHSVSQTSNEHGICMAVNYWYNMDFSCPLYYMFNFLRNITMIEDGRSDEIEFDKD